MTRRMADSISTAALEKVQNVDLLAGYVNGRWPTALTVKRADLRMVTISVNSETISDVYDVERGDIMPGTGAVPRALRLNPMATIYSTPRNWELVLVELHENNMPTPPLWAAVPGYDGLYPGSVATQYETRDGCDISTVVDYWPGIDPEPRMEHDMNVVHDVKTNRMYLLCDNKLTYIPDVKPDLANAEILWGKHTDFSPTFLSQFDGYRA